jgi:hypothetical protein
VQVLASREDAVQNKDTFTPEDMEPAEGSRETVDESIRAHEKKGDLPMARKSKDKDKESTKPPKKRQR